MNRISIKNIELKHYVGVTKAEQTKKNIIIIDFMYHTNSFIDYKEIYDKIIEKTVEKKWLKMEDLAKSIAEFLMNDYVEMKKCHILIKKEKPLKMNKCDYVSIEYEVSK